jgi:hypothetical protein
LRAAGATVVLKALEPSLQLAGRVLEWLGYPEERVAQCLEDVRNAELTGAKFARRNTGKKADKLSRN